MKSVVLAVGLFGLTATHAQGSRIEAVLTALTDAERNSFSAEAVRSAGHSCRSVSSSILRAVDDERNVHITARCTDGMDYAIMVAPDESTRILECGLLELVTGENCWEPLE